MTVETFPTAIYEYLDDNQQVYIERLRQAVAIPSVSQDTSQEGRQHVIDMSNFIAEQLRSLSDVEVKQVQLGKQPGTDVDLPPLVVGTLGNDPNKKTVLIYGHFDVQPAKKEDGWNTDPFTLTLVPSGDDIRMVGRGSTDDKGPVLGWINALEAYQNTNNDIPVNLKFCFEGMEEKSSEGLNDYIKEEAQGYFNGVDYVTICDNYWLNNRTPVVTYGLRGIAMYQLTVEGAPMNLHSGIYGGMIFEPMTDLITILSRLVNNQTKILIPGVENLVPEPTQEEIKLYEEIDYSVEDLNQATQANVGLSTDKVTLLMGRMRFPTLTIHEINNGSDPSADGVPPSTVIPHTVTAKFSMRLVPEQTPEVVTLLVENFIKEEFKNLNTKNKYFFKTLGETARPWKADFNGPSYVAGSAATEVVYKQVPNFDREGGSIGVAITLADAFGNDNVLLLPMGRGDDNPHAPNEKLDEANYFGGTKVMATYLWELAYGDSAAMVADH